MTLCQGAYASRFWLSAGNALDTTSGSSAFGGGVFGRLSWERPSHGAGEAHVRHRRKSDIRDELS